MKKKSTTSKPKTKNKGKPTTEERKRAFLEAFAQCRGIISRACQMIGLDRTTYYQWIDRDEAFAQGVKDALEEQVDFVEGNLLTLIESGDTTATIFYLKTRAKHRGYNERLELTGKEGKDLFANMTDEELQSEIEKLIKQQQENYE